MPMLEGGGGGVGASRPRRKLGPQEANVGYTPDEGEIARLTTGLAARHGLPEDNSFMDILHQTSDVFENAVGDVGELLRMPGDILNAFNTGHTPDTILREMASGAVESIPTSYDELEEYATENPLMLSLDLAGGLGAASRAPRALARGASLLDELMPNPALLDPAYPQAIGAIGKRLEAGDVPIEHELAGLVAPSQWSAAMPNKVMARFADEAEPAPFVQKLMGQSGDYSNQGMNEYIANRLNVLSEGELRMPGVGRMPDAEHQFYSPERLQGGGGKLIPGDKVTQDAALIEYLDDLQPVHSWEDLDWANPETTRQMRLMNIFDEVLGNDDRGYSANMNMLEDRVPVAVDQGLILENQGADFFSNRAWSGNLDLTPEEIAWVERMKAAAPTIPEIPQRHLGTLIDRIDRILQDRRLHDFYGEKRGAWDEYEEWPQFGAPDEGLGPNGLEGVDNWDRYAPEELGIAEPYLDEVNRLIDQMPGGQRIPVDERPGSFFLDEMMGRIRRGSLGGMPDELWDLVATGKISASEADMLMSRWNRGPMSGDPLPRTGTLSEAEMSWGAPVGYNAPPAMDPVEAMRLMLEQLQKGEV